MFDHLAPVGSRISLQTKGDVPWRSLYPNYATTLLDSGTSALAAAMLVAKSKARVSSGHEVILPAYGCPDLVSAAVYAGLKPVLVDFDSNSSCMSLALVEAALNKSTAAIVAVNFLGIPERLSELKLLAHGNGCLLIEDNAQWFPEPGYELYGDCVISSFGRGKPLSVLGGGMLLVANNLDASGVYNCQLADEVSEAFFLLKLAVYDVLISPHCFGLLDLLPLRLGETVYKRLVEIRAMPEAASKRLAANLARYNQRPLTAQQSISDLLKYAEDNFFDLPLGQAGGDELSARLLRYPLLVADDSQRDSLATELQRQGLGATVMYGKPLIDIYGVAEHVSLFQNDANARSFAARLITLPTHELVGQRHLKRLAKTLNLNALASVQ